MIHIKKRFQIRKQKGFSVTETLFMVLTLAILTCAGYYLWHKNHKTTTLSTTTTLAQKAVAKNFNECMELGGKQPPESATTTRSSCTIGGKIFNVVSGDNISAWSRVTSTQVHLRKWGVTLTVPQSLVGKLIYQIDPSENIYDFSTPELLKPSCIQFFSGTDQSEASVELDQYPLSKFDDSLHGTLLQYYQNHKAADGNYFVDPATSKADPITGQRRYWKIGNHFYYLITDYKPYKTAGFAAACPGGSSQYQSELFGSVRTISKW